MQKKLIIFFLLISTVSFAEPRVRPSDWATPVIGTELKNLYRVDTEVYRSEQPEEDGFKILKKFGVGEILNLRQYHSDNDDAEGSGLTLYRVSIDTGSISEAHLIKALTIIKNRKAPVLVHCWHGSDRTGAVIAAYRIIYNNWTKEKAIDEMKNGGFGYHAKIYPNIVELIEKLDISGIKKELGVKP